MPRSLEQIPNTSNIHIQVYIYIYRSKHPWDYVYIVGVEWGTVFLYIYIYILYIQSGTKPNLYIYTALINLLGFLIIQSGHISRNYIIILYIGQESCLSQGLASVYTQVLRAWGLCKKGHIYIYVSSVWMKSFVFL